MNFGGQHAIRTYAFVVLTILTQFIYYPSFYHAPHADQIEYYAEQSGRHGWFSLAIRSYDYNRTRFFSPGDQLLFRPVIFFILGTELYVFGHHFMLWQITGVIAHIWVVWCLLSLLQRIQPGIFSILLTTFFATLFINMDMVTWQAVSAYMFFWGLMLAVLEQSYICAYQQWQSWRLWLMAGLLLIAVFTYEIGSVYALLIALFLWVSCRKKKVGLLLIPVLLYALISFWNFSALHLYAAEGQKILCPPIIDFLKQMALIGKEWLFLGIFPDNIHMFYRGEQNFASHYFYLYRPKAFLMPLGISNTSDLESFLLVMLYCWGVGRSAMKDRWKVHGNFLVLLTLMLLAYIALIVFGRNSGANLYYIYGFWALLVTIIAVGILGILIIENSTLLQRGLKEQAGRDKDTIALCRALDGFIEAHKKEKDFSFYVDPDCPGNYIYGGLTNPKQPMRRYSFVEGMYLQYFKTKGAKYTIMSDPPARQ